VLWQLRSLSQPGVKPPEPAWFFFQAELSHGVGPTEPSQAKLVKKPAFSS